MKSIFVIGDSISIQYGPYLEKMLDGKYSYSRKGGLDEALQNLDIPQGANGGDSSMVLEYIKSILTEGWNTDLLLLNCGLHDIKKDPQSRAFQISGEEYARNLENIYQLLTENGIKTVWIRSTPVDDNQHNSRCSDFKRYGADLEEYNRIADKEAIKGGAEAVIDLYGFTCSLGGIEVFCDHVHFTEKVRELQAAYIAGAVDMIMPVQG